MFTLFNEKLANVGKEVYDMNQSYFSFQWSDEKLNDYQLEKLKKTVTYVKEKSPFYKNHFSGINSDFIENLNFDSFQEVAYTDKNDLRREMNNMLSRPISECCFFYETTGTTGVATPCPRDYVDTIYNNIAVTKCLETILKKGDKKHTVGVCGPTEVHSFGDTLGDVCKNMELAMAKFWPYSPVIGIKKGVDLLKTLKISAMMCTPGMALTFAKVANELGYDLKKDFDLEILMLTGELSTPSMLENIGNLWGAKVYNFLYGSQEALVLATCVENGKLHTFPVNHYYEVIDPDTLKHAPLKDDHFEGELVVTTLFQGSKPLVRYRTGDLVRLYPAKENDIYPSPTIEILGRTRDSLNLNNKKIAAFDIEQLLMKQLSNCLGYQITIYNQNGLDKLKIQLEMLKKEDENPEYLEKAINAFKSLYDLESDASFDKLGSLGSTGSMVSWKSARIVDTRVEEPEEKKIAREMGKRRDSFLSQ